MLITSKERTINTLGCPIIYPVNSSTELLSVFQGISIACSAALSTIFLSSLSIHKNHINAVFTKNPTEGGNGGAGDSTIDSNVVCYLDVDIDSNSLIYELQSGSAEFVGGFVTLAGTPTMELDYKGAAYVNPLYIHRCSAQTVNRYELKLYTTDANNNVVLVDSLDLHYISVDSTPTVTASRINNNVYLDTNDSTTAVNAEHNDYIISINGEAITNGSYTIDLGDYCIVNDENVTNAYIELDASPANSCPTLNYIADTLAPKGRTYPCPIDILYYAPNTNLNRGTIPAVWTDYNIENISNIRFNTEYSGVESANGSYSGLSWDTFNDLHDIITN